MQIKIKTQDIEIEYSDDMSEIRDVAVKNIKTIVESIFLESAKKAANSKPIGVINLNPNGSTSINTSTPFFRNPPDINLNNK
jgi:hypothetical protein